jgi:hypothetical protein
MREILILIGIGVALGLPSICAVKRIVARQSTSHRKLNDAK